MTACNCIDRSTSPCPVHGVFLMPHMNARTEENTMCIEHPDHTGSSANPFAPWSQLDAEELDCYFCEDEIEPGEQVEAKDRGQAVIICHRCDSGPSDEEQYRAAEAASLMPTPDARDKHTLSGAA